MNKKDYAIAAGALVYLHKTAEVRAESEDFDYEQGYEILSALISTMAHQMCINISDEFGRPRHYGFNLVRKSEGKSKAMFDNVVDTLAAEQKELRDAVRVQKDG